MAPASTGVLIPLSSQMPDLHLPASISVYGVTGIAAALVVLVKLSRPSKLDAIPTVGSNGWLDSWWAGLKFFTKFHEVIPEGCAKYKGAPFKVAQMYNWLVVLSSHEHVDELRRIPEEVMSQSEGLRNFLSIDYAFELEDHHNHYQVTVVRGPLTRNIGLLYPEMRDEMTTAFDDVLDLTGNEWKGIPVVNSIRQVVCRTSNRVFVGLPLCRDPEWVDLNIHHTIDVFKAGNLIEMFPSFLRPIIARICTNFHQNNSRARRLLGPIIEERQRHLKEYGGEWADKPNDFLSWLMDVMEGPESTIKGLTARMLLVNFAAIHTTSLSITRALFYLAANPQYIQPLRDEVEPIVEKEGWSKASLAKMRKIDSFLKECHRLAGLILNVHRVAMKDFTFADGTFIPKGTLIAVTPGSIHWDDTIYENAREFKPFRFSDSPGEDTKYTFTSTTPEYLPFWHGRNACPGRFFAASELKSMLAHVVVTYDIRLPENTTPSKSMHSAAMIGDPNVQVMFRKRVS